MTDNNFIDKYVNKEKTSFFSNSKSWLFLVVIIVAIVLAIVFYKTVIVGIMSPDELQKSIQIVWHETKWVEKESIPQEVKIVPCISFKIKNTGDAPLQYVDMEAVFDFEETGTNHSDGVVSILDEPLKPGDISDVITIQSMFGYAATSKAAFMKNKSEWKKMVAKIFARSRGSGLVRIGNIFPINQVIEGYKEDEPEEAREYKSESTKELARSLQALTPEAQWIPKIVTDKEAIIVPYISFTLKNTGEKPFQYLIFKAVFRFVETGEVLSEGIVPALSEPLLPGVTGNEITVKADFGYSATSIDAFYYNLQGWKNLKVNLFARTKESEYALLGTFTVKKAIKGVKVNYQQAY